MTNVHIVIETYMTHSQPEAKNAQDITAVNIKLEA